MTEFLSEVKKQVTVAATELVTKGYLKSGDTVVIGCSTSEVVGGSIGKNGSIETAETIYSALRDVFGPLNINIAAQCCEHLNRALVIEQSAVKTQEVVCAVPQMHAGGSFATVVYNNMKSPVLVEEISANAGLDIGGTLIGMHLKRVAVPLRLSVKNIGKAILLAAYTRPKYIGGERAKYQ